MQPCLQQVISKTTFGIQALLTVPVSSSFCCTTAHATGRSRARRRVRCQVIIALAPLRLLTPAQARASCPSTSSTSRSILRLDDRFVGRELHSSYSGRQRSASCCVYRSTGEPWVVIMVTVHSYGLSRCNYCVSNDNTGQCFRPSVFSWYLLRLLSCCEGVL